MRNHPISISQIPPRLPQASSFSSAGGDDCGAQELPGPCCRGLGVAPVPVVPPQQGPQDPAAIQRRARQHVEGGQQAVHRRQPHRRCDQQGSAPPGIPEGELRAEENAGRRHARGRPGQRDPQVGTGVGRLTLKFGDPADVHSVIDRTVTPLRRATSACESSWASSDARNNTAPATATVQYAAAGWCGSAPGRKLAPSSQAMSTRMTATVQFAPTGIPPTRPSRTSCRNASPHHSHHKAGPSRHAAKRHSSCPCRTFSGTGGKRAPVLPRTLLIARQDDHDRARRLAHVAAHRAHQQPGDVLSAACATRLQEVMLAASGS